MSDHCCAPLPCLDEAAVIGDLVRRIRRPLAHGAGSWMTVQPDGTATLAQAAGATVLRNGRPQGKGAALASGWSRAAEGVSPGDS
jgi:hypothetical protein